MTAWMEPESIMLSEISQATTTKRTHGQNQEGVESGEGGGEGWGRGGGIFLGV